MRTSIVCGVHVVCVWQQKDAHIINDTVYATVIPILESTAPTNTRTASAHVDTEAGDEADAGGPSVRDDADATVYTAQYVHHVYHVRASVLSLPCTLMYTQHPFVPFATCSAAMSWWSQVLATTGSVPHTRTAFVFLGGGHFCIA